MQQSPWTGLVRPSRPISVAEPTPRRGARLPPLDAPFVPNPWHLTAAEFEVMRLTMEFLSTKEIADMLGRSISTIESHRERAKSRMNARSLVEAAVIWDRHFRDKDAK